MTEKIPSNEALRKKRGVIDQRQQQIDPAGKHRVNQNDADPKRSQKALAQGLHKSEEDSHNGE